MSTDFDWRKGRTTVSKCFYHLVLTPKYRRKVFTLAMLDALEPLVKETCEQMGGELLEFGCEDDHLHLMVVIPPAKSVSNFVGKIKGKSSYFLRKNHWPEVRTKLWGNHFWSPSYCVVTCGGAPLDVVKKYVESQSKPEKLAARLGAEAPEVAPLNAQVNKQKLLQAAKPERELSLQTPSIFDDSQCLQGDCLGGRHPYLHRRLFAHAKTYR